MTPISSVSSAATFTSVQPEPAPIGPAREKFSLVTPRENTREAPLLLLIDDGRVMRMVMQYTLERMGYQVVVAENGEDAMGLLIQYGNRIDAVMLDREMQGVDGPEVTRHMKADSRFNEIPVIMFVNDKEQEKIQEGIDAGIFYYIVKPADNGAMQSVIGSALRESQQKRSLMAELSLYGNVPKMVQSCQMSVRTLKEARDAACFLAASCPDPQRVATGFMELLNNAIQHGNFAIGYEEKEQLVAQNRWHEEIENRVDMPVHKDKKVEVAYQRRDNNHLVQITDAGPGFDWKRYWHINPSRATSTYGRGIARARLLSFDRMSYNDKGNSVTVMVNGDGASAYAW